MLTSIERAVAADCAENYPPGHGFSYYSDRFCKKVDEIGRTAENG